MKRAAGRFVILLLLTHVSVLPVFAQTNVSGVVNDIKGVGIEGVTVTEKGTGNAITTDNTGHFTITVKDGNGTLVFSHTAFQMQELPLRNRSSVSIVMAET